MVLHECSPQSMNIENRDGEGWPAYGVIGHFMMFLSFFFGGGVCVLHGTIPPMDS
jgi:hypothetical protein